MHFQRLSRENGLWSKLWVSWDAICEKYSESFAEFVPSALSVLKPLADDPQLSHAGVYGLVEGEDIRAVCQLNVANLPGYDGKVLRLRHMVLSPEFEFSDDISVDDYVSVLAEMFSGALVVSDGDMLSEHVKLHLRTPLDIQFFNHFRDKLSLTAKFDIVQMRGAWLYITKKKAGNPLV